LKKVLACPADDRDGCANHFLPKVVVVEGGDHQLEVPEQMEQKEEHKVPL